MVGVKSSILERDLAKNGSIISFSPALLRSYTSEFCIQLGEGGFGIVYKGEFPNGLPFAIKLLHDRLSGECVENQFRAEVETIGSINHPNLVKVFGYCFHPEMKAIVYEYMENGSLNKLLKNPNLEWRKLHNIVTDTAKGISYLHKKQIIHLDIKPANVLIDSDFCCKVADYGLAKQYQTSLSHVPLSKFQGTRGFAAPELSLNYHSFRGTFKCDVYSFGMLVFEVVESKKKGGKNDQSWFPSQVFKIFKQGKLEEFLINDCDTGIQEIEVAMKLVLVAICCIQLNPENRPSMSTVVKTLQGEIQDCVPTNAIIPESYSSATEATLALPNRERMPVGIDMNNQENKVIKPQVVKKDDEVTTVVLKVYMHCEDCARKIENCLKRMEGVLTAAADQENSLVTVKCVIAPNKLVDRILKKFKKRASIVELEPEKKQEENDVELGMKKEGMNIFKYNLEKTKEELHTVKTKDEGNGVFEVKLMKNDETDKEEKEKTKENLELKLEDNEKMETKLMKEGESQDRIKEEGRRVKFNKKKKENLSTMETKSEGKKEEEPLFSNCTLLLVYFFLTTYVVCFGVSI